MKRKIALLGISLLLVTGFFLLPRNHKWMERRIVTYWKDFQKQNTQLDIEHRKIERYGSSYTYSKIIADFFEKKGSAKNVLILIPPTAYFKSNGVDYHVPEPAVFYYFTGIKTIWINSKDAVKANWYVKAVHGNIIIDSVSSEISLADTITTFKKFSVEL